MAAKTPDRRAFAEKYLQEKRQKGTDDGWTGPTEIGTAMGFEYSRASSRMMSSLKTLVQHGVVETNGEGKYRWKK
jgi:hypothetical protein